MLARIMDVPVVASFHTELSVYARLRTGDPRVEAAAAMALAVFYGAADHVLSPSSAGDATLRALGVDDDAHRPLGPRRRHRPLRRRTTARAGLLPGEAPSSTRAG